MRRTKRLSTDMEVNNLLAAASSSGRLRSPHYRINGSKLPCVVQIKENLGYQSVRKEKSGGILGPGLWNYELH